MFKGSLLLLLDSCTTPLPAKLHALIHPPSHLANQERLWTFDLDKSQVGGRNNCIRDIRRSHCQPFCACVLLSGSEHMLAPSWSGENCLVKIFCLLCVCFWHRRVITSNSRDSGCGGSLLNWTLSSIITGQGDQSKYEDPNELHKVVKYLRWE
jgi:hypothetical protein